MKILTIMSLGLAISAMSLFKAAQAGEIDQVFFCKVTVQGEGKTKYPLFVPKKNMKDIQEKFNVVGLNCRNENRVR